MKLVYIFYLRKHMKQIRNLIDRKCPNYWVENILSTIKDIREEYGRSRAELERRIGVADRRLVRYESGETPQNNMDLIIAYRISKVLKCKMEDLLELEDEKK